MPFSYSVHLLRALNLQTVLRLWHHGVWSDCSGRRWDMSCAVALVKQRAQQPERRWISEQWHFGAPAIINPFHSLVMSSLMSLLPWVPGGLLVGPPTDRTWWLVDKAAIVSIGLLFLGLQSSCFRPRLLCRSWPISVHPFRGQQAACRGLWETFNGKGMERTFCHGETPSDWLMFDKVCVMD